MLLEIQLLYFILMIATFVVLLLWAKMPIGVSLMASAVVGSLASAIIGPFIGEPTTFELRHFVEGAFGYFDTVLIIVTAMLFISTFRANGGLDYVGALLVKAFRRFPTLLLIVLMILVMFPAMVTGISMASAIMSGALVGAILIKWGVPRAKAGAVVAVGAMLGVVAPPINVPAMLICDLVDQAYVDFAMPLLLCSLPIAIVAVLLIARKYVKPISKEELPMVVNTKVFEEMNWTVTIPFVLVILFMVLEMVFPKVLGSFGMSGMFVVCTIINCFVGRRLPFFAKEKKPQVETAEKAEGAAEDGEIAPAPAKKYDDDFDDSSILSVLRFAVRKSYAPVGLLLGIGMFMEVMGFTGIRAYFVTNVFALPMVGGTHLLSAIAMLILTPAFGGLSSFCSATIFGGPFVMVFKSQLWYATLIAGLSLLTVIGEIIPPTAICSTFAADAVGEKSWAKVTKASLVPVAVVLGYAIVCIFGFGTIIQKFNVDVSVENWYLILLAGTLVLAVVFALCWWAYCKNGKYAFDVTSQSYAQYDRWTNPALATATGKLSRKKGKAEQSDEVQSDDSDK